MLINFNYTPLLCHYGMLVCSAKIIVLLTVHLVFCFFHSYQPFESHYLVVSHQLQEVMTVTSTMYCVTVCTQAQ